MKNIILNKSFVGKNTSDHACQIFCSKSNCNYISLIFPPQDIHGQNNEQSEYLLCPQLLGTDHLTCRGVMGVFFRTTRELEYFFFCRAKLEFVFQNLTLGYMTKTLNQIVFFSSNTIRIFLSATLGIRMFFLGKNHTPPPHTFQVKWSFP